MAAGALGSAAISGNASSSAAAAQTNAANNAANLQMQMYNQTRADQSPWRVSGGQALSALDAWYGLPGFSPGSSGSDLTGLPISSSAETTGGGIMGIVRGVPWLGEPLTGRNLIDAQHVFFKPPRNENTPDISGQGGVVGNAGGQLTPEQQREYMKQTIENQPGYQFQMDQGSQALQRSMAARGLLNSGAAAKALTQYGQGYASSAANDYLNGLRSLAGLGQTASTATGMAATATANQVGNSMMNAGNAAAYGYANQGNAYAAGFSGLTDALKSYYDKKYPTPTGTYPGWSSYQPQMGSDPFATGSGSNPWTETGST
jgi:hypothetical protein